MFLGALLSIGGGFLAQRNQGILNRKEEDQRILWEIEKYLLDYHASQSQLQKTAVNNKDQQLRYEYELVSLRENLNHLALRLKSKKYREIAIRVAKFCLDAHLRTQENLNILTRQVQLNINEKMIRQYEKEIKENPDNF